MCTLFCSAYKRNNQTANLEKNDIKMNNCTNNPKGNIMYYLWVIKWLCCKTCERVLIIRDSHDVEKSTIRHKPRDYELGWKRLRRRWIKQILTYHTYVYKTDTTKTLT
jgi:hypothetical protein